jgi:hypothetical protein
MHFAAFRLQIRHWKHRGSAAVDPYFQSFGGRNSEAIVGIYSVMFDLKFDYLRPALPKEQ